MSFRLLVTPEPLLRPGHFVGMIGDWGDKFEKKWYRVNFALQTKRDYYYGIMSRSATSALTINPDTGWRLQPRYYSTLYQCRIGLSPDWLMYIRWPTTAYRGGLEEPAYDPVPTEGAGTTTQRRYIGFVDAKDSPISNKLDDLRFEWIFVRDWMPIFQAYPDSVEAYVKLINRVIVNRLRIEPVVSDITRKRLEEGEQVFLPVYHYSEYEKLSAGLALPVRP